MIDLLNIEPNKPSKNLQNFVGIIYGDPGCGKTSLAAQIPKSLLIATEVGYKAIPGVKAQPALDYTSMLTILNQLKKPEVKEMYDLIILDTMDAFLHISQTHVLSTNGVSALNDIPWGGGHVQLEQIWKKVIKTIIKEGYGLLMIGHRAQKIDEEEEKYNTLALSNKRVKQYVISEADYMAYVESSRDPSKPSIMHFRPSLQWEAKARFANIVPNIEFSYSNLVKAIHDAIESVAPDATEERLVYSAKEDVKMDETEFAKLKEMTEAVAKGIIEKDNNLMGKVVSTIDQYLGKKIGEAIPSDGERMKLLKEELERF